MSRLPRIVVVGSANTDMITFSDTFPRPGETIFGTGFDLGFGGKGANQAVAARYCGADVAMVANVGQDLFGEATVKNFAFTFPVFWKQCGTPRGRQITSPADAVSVFPPT